MACEVGISAVITVCDRIGQLKMEMCNERMLNESEKFTILRQLFMKILRKLTISGKV